MRQSVLTHEYNDEVQRFIMNAAMGLRGQSGIPHDTRVRMEPYVRMAEEIFLTAHRLSDQEIIWKVPAKTKTPEQWFNLISGLNVSLPHYYDHGNKMPWYKKLTLFFRKIKK